MRRGETWTVSGGKDYAGKPRSVDKITTVSKSKIGARVGRLDRTTSSDAAGDQKDLELERLLVQNLIHSASPR